jgi:hypothetical protein
MTESERNHKGKEHESTGNVEGAIELYEQNVTLKSIAPHPYKRLAIIYRKLNRLEDEIRVLKLLVSVSENEGKKWGWKEGSRQYEKIDSYRKQLDKAQLNKAKSKT